MLLKKNLYGTDMVIAIFKVVHIVVWCFFVSGLKKKVVRLMKESVIMRDGERWVWFMEWKQNDTSVGTQGKKLIEAMTSVCVFICVCCLWTLPYGHISPPAWMNDCFSLFCSLFIASFVILCYLCNLVIRWSFSYFHSVFPIISQYFLPFSVVFIFLLCAKISSSLVFLNHFFISSTSISFSRSLSSVLLIRSVGFALHVTIRNVNLFELYMERMVFLLLLNGVDYKGALKVSLSPSLSLVLWY